MSSNVNSTLGMENFSKNIQLQSVTSEDVDHQPRLKDMLKKLKRFRYLCSLIAADDGDGTKEIKRSWQWQEKIDRCGETMEAQE